ncbi:MAG: biotin synthase BioB [Candidatus Aegiribacteria sp.]|nr:biotin synthase BioB [Candidatus Aegiribacteria sp.]MBD3294014.1 biotin synthase BioB [Candidatus Fermentibacteria bacterium]
MSAISCREANRLLGAPGNDLEQILAAAFRIREEHFSRNVSICSIINARSGLCDQDCRFCAQSSRSRVPCSNWPMKKADCLLKARREAGQKGVSRFSAVSSGRGPGTEEIEELCEAMEVSGDGPPLWCASLGIIGTDDLMKLKKAGLTRYHHNLETSRSFFGTVCTTHTWEDRADTVVRVKEAGLEVCSGGIIGLGESPDQRVEMAFQLKELQVDSVALNFYIAVPGSALQPLPEQMSPFEMLKTVAMFRLVNPGAEIRICAGRGLLGGMESLVFRAGATGIMSGELLTTPGSGYQQDLDLIKTAGMEPVV